MAEPTIAEILAEARRLEADAQAAMDARQPLTANVAIRLRNEFRLEHFPRLAAVAEAALVWDEKAQRIENAKLTPIDDRIAFDNAGIALRRSLRSEEGGANG